MSFENNSFSKVEFEIWLIGFRLDPGSQVPDFYTLVNPRNKDHPLMVDDRIVFFNNLRLIEKAFSLSNLESKELYTLPEQVDLTCDVAGMLYLITNEDLDSSAIILNCLNTIFDLVKATDISMPAEYRRILFLLADHLTFHKEYESFFNLNKIERSIVRDGVLWCVGAIVLKAKFLVL